MTETVKHTPGPWLVHGGMLGHKGDVFVPTEKSVSDCHHIARCFAPKPIKNPIDDLQVIVVERDAIKIVEANARLIAAAPDLHEAGRKLAAEVGGLRDFEHEIRAVIGNTNWSVLIDRLVGMDAAIAKAEPSS